MKLLIGYDGSECADIALQDLRRLGLPERADVRVVSVIEHWLPPPSSIEMLESVDRRTEALTLARRGSFQVVSMMPQWNVEAEAGYGSAASVLIEKAEAWNADLILVGSHGRSAVGRLLFGSVSQKLLHEAHCSVHVARGRVEEPGTPARLLVGVDGSKGAEAAVRVIAARHWPDHSEVRIVNAAFSVPPTGSESMMSRVAEWIANEKARVNEAVESAARTLAASGLQVSVVSREEDPKQLLLDEAERWGADCIFVGAKGLGRVERLLIGSVSSAVAARAHCSVEVIRGY